MFTCRLHSPDGDDLGEATYPDMVKIGEELFFGGGRRFRVVDVEPFDDEAQFPRPVKGAAACLTAAARCRWAGVVRPPQDGGMP